MREYFNFLNRDKSLLENLRCIPSRLHRFIDTSIKEKGLAYKLLLLACIKDPKFLAGFIRDELTIFKGKGKLLKTLLLEFTRNWYHCKPKPEPKNMAPSASTIDDIVDEDGCSGDHNRCCGKHDHCCRDKGPDLSDLKRKLGLIDPKKDPDNNK